VFDPELHVSGKDTGLVNRYEQMPSVRGPAVDLFQQLVGDSAAAIELGGLPLLTQDRDLVLNEHLENVVPRVSRGWMLLAKESDDSPNKIDGAECAVNAVSRAMWHYLNPAPVVRRVPMAAWV
jgi:hypothetical protein